MNRDEVLAFAKSAYGTDPEYLWKRSPDSAVLRQSENQKWYGIVMNVSWRALGIEEEGFVDVLDVKCSPDMMGAILMTKGILPGYHMNKNSWISILLDGTVPEEMVKNLMDLSFELTSSKNRGGRSKGMRTTKWIIPSNPKYFDVD